jgi:hypothetical protein
MAPACSTIKLVPNASRHEQHLALIALGASIRRIRLANGISQEQLALMAEVDRSYVGRVERGDNNVALLTLVPLQRSSACPRRPCSLMQGFRRLLDNVPLLLGTEQVS